MARAKKISQKISRGIGHLMKKNKITVFNGRGHLQSEYTLNVQSGTKTETLNFKNLIIATGAKYRTFPGLSHDGSSSLERGRPTQLEKLPNRWPL